MKKLIDLFKITKPALTVSILAMALVMSGAANAKAKWVFKVCLDKKSLVSATANMTQSGGTANVSYLGNTYVFASAGFPDCPNTKEVTATDNSGNWNAQSVGYQQGMALNMTSPYITADFVDGTTCQTSMGVNWKITSIDSSKYRIFRPISDLPIRLMVTGSVGSQLSCTMAVGN